MTDLKAFLHRLNVQFNNPTLFKKVNDRCKKEKFKGKLNKEEFIKLFMNQDLLEVDIKDTPHTAPSLE